ncbi:hypothetical protein AA310_00850 [Arthrobacter sp. YC-RL1]|nr:hypothetical protein ATC04_18185 [Arthrobacter sp. YC-RL1]KLI90514.1 hypothetical protein AA310_00850 [Arthrobacter sp. YC-RL1]
MTRIRLEVLIRDGPGIGTRARVFAVGLVLFGLLATVLMNRLTKIFDFLGPADPIFRLQPETIGCFLGHLIKSVSMVFQRVIQIFELVMTDADINMLSGHLNYPRLFERLNFWLPAFKVRA